MKSQNMYYFVYIYILWNEYVALYELLFFRLLSLSIKGSAKEEPKQVLTFSLCQIMFFFSIEWTKVDVISVSVARNFRDLTSLGLSHSPLFHCMIWRQSGFLRKRNYKSNTFLDNNLNKWLRIQNSNSRMRRLHERRIFTNIQKAFHWARVSLSYFTFTVFSWKT